MAVEYTVSCRGVANSIAAEESLSVAKCRLDALVMVSRQSGGGVFGAVGTHLAMSVHRITVGRAGRN